MEGRSEKRVAFHVLCYALYSLWRDPWHLSFTGLKHCHLYPELCVAACVLVSFAHEHAARKRQIEAIER